MLDQLVIYQATPVIIEAAFFRQNTIDFSKSTLSTLNFFFQVQLTHEAANEQRMFRNALKHFLWRLITPLDAILGFVILKVQLY